MFSSIIEEFQEEILEGVLECTLTLLGKATKFIVNVLTDILD